MTSDKRKISGEQPIITTMRYFTLKVIYFFTSKVNYFKLLPGNGFVGLGLNGIAITRVLVFGIIANK